MLTVSGVTEGMVGTTGKGCGWDDAGMDPVDGV